MRREMSRGHFVKRQMKAVSRRIIARDQHHDFK